ncbi:MAG TPA: condensation domain-containing protein, partial [Thermoanaerobaculia bacterium]|nr:condensation domain-containing protein [Thermoanaerobaculia bacterium]
MRPENLESIYRLTSVQEGILFHSLHEPENGLYVRQLVCRLHGGPLAIDKLEQAWISLLHRHAVLRTSFHWEDVAHPVQVVARQVELPWEERDWRGLCVGEQKCRLAELLRAGRERDFALADPPLIRLTRARTGEESYNLVWSFHHLIIDGWSIRLILREVLSAYAAYAQGPIPELRKIRLYRDFVAWLQRHSSESESFWRQNLAGFSAPTSLALNRVETCRRSYEEFGVELSEEITAALAGVAKRHGLTINILLQVTWALLLSRYGGVEDMVFGITVSGRSAPLPGIETMVGLFINTLPLRIQVQPDSPLIPWLTGIQEADSELLQHEHTPLTEIHGWSGDPRIQILSRAAQSGLLLTPHQIFHHPTVADLAAVAVRAQATRGRRRRLRSRSRPP